MPAAFKSNPFPTINAGGTLGTWPGQAGNLVGYLATPTAQPRVWSGGTWPGAWPGSFTGGGPISTNAYATNLGGTIPSGSPGNPTIIAFVDFTGATSNSGGNNISSDGNDHAGGFALHDVTFVGCRFTGGSILNYNIECFKNGSSNITFSYCTVAPLNVANAYFSKVPSPAVLSPRLGGGGYWPCASVGTGLQDGGGGVKSDPGGGSGQYQIPYLSGYLYGMSIGSTSGTFLLVDHCDIWGGGIAINTAGTSTTQMTFTDNWMHDNRYPGPPLWDSTFTYSGSALVGGAPTSASAFVTGSNGAIYACVVASSLNHDPTTGSTDWSQVQNSGDHGEVAGFTTGSNPPPVNVTFRHNTMAVLGNTGVFAWQSTGGAYNNISMINNYMSGTQSVVDTGSLASGTNTNWTFTDNVFATDLLWFTATIDHSTNPMQAQFTQSNGNNNVWRRNKLRVFPGDTWSNFSGSGFPPPNAQYDGFYVLPGSISVGTNLNATDWAL
jgi:hypothetical protein